MMIYLAERREVVTIDGLGTWPRAADIRVFNEQHGGKMPPGILRTVIPAAPYAWITALEKFGPARLALMIRAPFVQAKSMQVIKSESLPAPELFRHLQAIICTCHATPTTPVPPLLRDWPETPTLACVSVKTYPSTVMLPVSVSEAPVNVCPGTKLMMPAGLIVSPVSFVVPVGPPATPLMA